MNILKRWYSAIFGVGVVIYLIANQSLKENTNNVYRSSNLKTEIKFSHADVGLKVRHILNFPVPPGEEGYYRAALLPNAMPNSFTVTDLNGDEFVDICVINPEYKNAVRCFFNNNGISFSEATAALGLPTLFEFLPSAIYSADFNNDSLSDLLVANFGKHDLYLRKSKGGFVRVENEWFSNAFGANFADFNSDGLLDVVIANYFGRVDPRKERLPWNYTGTADTHSGDINEIWLNQGNGKFKLEKDLLPSPYKEHTTVIGIADYNRDGRIDLYEGNDFSIDHMYSLDEQTKKFVETTKKTNPLVHHGFSSMNSEFADLNGDGFLDLFVTNMVVPPLVGWSNTLWIYNPQTSEFEERAKDLGLDRCGYAWTAKAADFNLDGVNEVIVSSGFHTAATARINFLFYRMASRTTPKWFKAEKMHVNIEDFELGIEPRPCLFYKSGEKYVDILESSLEWNKAKASRSLVILDMNNDGKTDLLIPEHDGVPQFYKNDSTTSNNWVGITFINKSGSRVNFGVQAEVIDSQKRPIEYFEFNPANGQKTQNDYRKIVGLGSQTEAYINIYSKSILLRTEKLTVNKYNDIKVY